MHITIPVHLHLRRPGREKIMKKKSISILFDGFEKNTLFLWNSKSLKAACKPSIYLSLICQYTFVDDTIVMFLFSSPWGGLEMCCVTSKLVLLAGGATVKYGGPHPAYFWTPITQWDQWFTKIQKYEITILPTLFRLFLMWGVSYFQIFPFGLYWLKTNSGQILFVYVNPHFLLLILTLMLSLQRWCGPLVPCQYPLFACLCSFTLWPMRKNLLKYF